MKGKECHITLIKCQEAEARPKESMRRFSGGTTRKLNLSNPFGTPKIRAQDEMFCDVEACVNLGNRICTGKKLKLSECLAKA